jgi:2-keto-4-pentenoate hydratase/2-oxohepta-3-ene-1,7-dioic acid hydratase in catechol pathway
VKLASYRKGGKDSYGAVVGEGIVDLGGRVGGKYPTLKDAIAGGALDELRKAVEGANPDVKLGEVELRLPITAPDKIFCIGRNYPAYHEIQQTTIPKWPSVFPRYLSSFAASNEAIIKPKVSDQLDWEGELAIVMGRRGRHIPEASWRDYVAGYTILNEGSVRDWQSKGTQNCPGKNFYRSGAIGPWLVTRDEIADPMRLALRTRLNGETMQDGLVGDMIFGIDYVIAHVTKFTWIEPGDVITMGSPGGTIISRKTGKWMKPGDTVELEIESIGTLRNPVEAE